MRFRNGLAAAILGSGLGAFSGAWALSNQIPPGIDWVNNWDGALAAAAERGVPLLVSFANDD